MLYSAFISRLRTLVGDNPRRMAVGQMTGDGTTTVFQIPLGAYPVLDQAGTYTVQVNSVTKSEGSDYTLDKQTGTIVFASAPTSGHAVTISHQAVHLLDATWLNVINDVIYSMGDDFWKAFEDTTLTTTANMLSLSLASAQPRCIAIDNFFHRTSSTVDWQPVEEITTWRYSRDENAIYLAERLAFTASGQPLRVVGRKSYAIGAAVSDTLDVQDRYLTVLENGCAERYYQHRYRDVIELVTKGSVDQSRTPLQELIMLADRYRRLYEAERSKLKPQKPARIIPIARRGAGRP